MGLKALVPRPLKRALKTWRSQRLMTRACANLREGKPLSAVLDQFVEAWGDDGFSATRGYLDEVVETAIKAKGPILEIGSGLTTIILNTISDNVYSFEHSPEFYNQTLSRLRALNLRPQIQLAPLKAHEDFDWYGPDLSSTPRNFALVIADGPPGNTRGGRYGLLPVMRQYFRDDATILLDDAERPSEAAVLDRWASEFGLTYSLRTHGAKKWAVCHF